MEAQDIIEVAANWGGLGPLASSVPGLSFLWAASVLTTFTLTRDSAPSLLFTGENHSNKTVMCLEDIAEDLGVPDVATGLSLPSPLILFILAQSSLSVMQCCDLIIIGMA